MTSDKTKTTIYVDNNTLKKFKKIASSKTFQANWFSLGVEEALLDYINKYGG